MRTILRALLCLLCRSGLCIHPRPYVIIRRSGLRKKNAPKGYVYFIPKALTDNFFPKCLRTMEATLVLEVVFIGLVTGVTNYYTNESASHC